MKAVVIALALMTPAAFAATRTWTGAAGATWSNPANWDGGVPQAGDDVVFPSKVLFSTTTTNDLPSGLQLRSITVSGPYKMTGNDILLGEGGLFNAMEFYNSLLESDVMFSGVTLTSSQSWTGPPRVMRTVVGQTNINGKTLTLSISPVLQLQSISGDGAIVQDTGFTLVGASGFNGSITVNGGSLDLFGTAGSGRVNGGALVLTGASLGDVTIEPGGGLDPTTLPSSVGNMTFVASSARATQFGAPFGQGLVLTTLHVNGRVALGNARLNIAAGRLAEDSVGILIDNDGVDPVDGTFMGLPEGSVISGNGVSFRISYIGGDGNDVTVTVVPRLGDTKASLTAAGATLTATVSSYIGVVPQGSVSFYDGAVLLGTSTLDASGRASFVLRAGTHEINAVYGGSQTFAASLGTLTVTNRIRAVRSSSR